MLQRFLRPILRVLGTASLVFFLVHCASTNAEQSVGKVYTAPTVERVTVLSRSAERVSATQGNLGGRIGSLAGSYGGGIAGSVAGGIVGPALEKAVMKRTVSNYAIRKADGTTVTLMQDDEKAAPLTAGQSAYLIHSAGESRISATSPAGIGQ